METALAGGGAVSEPAGALESWMGRDVVDTTGRAIGPVVGRAYARKRFGINRFVADWRATFEGIAS